MSCTFAADRAFGPAVASCRRAFDFTLYFEELFFALIPSSLLLMGAATRLCVLLRRPVHARWGLLYFLKLGAVSAFAVLELVTLILIATGQGATTRLSVPAAVLSLLAACGIAILSHYEHTRSNRPSFFLAFYLCLTALLRSAMTRTYWSLEAHRSVAGAALAALLVQLFMAVLESGRLRGLEDTKQSPEESASFVSRSLFLWLNRLLWTGYQRTLTAADLGPIHRSLYTAQLDTQFSRISTRRSISYFGLPGRALLCLGRYLFLPIIPRLCLTGFTFAQPFLATELIRYLGDESAPKNTGYGLVGASFLVYGGIAISRGWYSHLNYKAVTCMRGGLVDIVFNKVLRLPEDKENESKALTLMNSDAQRISTTLAFLHELWAGLLETALATWLLWRQVGPSSLTVVGLALASTVVSTFIGKSTGPQQQRWMKATENRVSATRKMLSSLKAIRMTGSGLLAGTMVEDFRLREFAASKIFRRLIVGGVLSSYTTLTISPVLVFGTYIGTTLSQHRNLDPARLFTSLILITLLASPLIHILQMFPSLGAAKGCFQRIEAFLEKPERFDYRHLASDHPSQDQMENENDVSSEQDNSAKSAKVTALPVDTAISVQEGEFGWTTEPHLHAISLNIRKGEHVVITGPVGAGKSLLLKSLLGEAKCTGGSVQLGSSRIGYCGQAAWIENTTALENAFRCAQEDPAWRRKVIDACALGDVIESQPTQATVGSGGVRISGGEKHRLALARTIAWKPDIILLDDVFSALDQKTVTHVRDSLFGPRGLLRSLGITVIETTNHERWAAMVDSVYQIDETGHLVSCDSPVSSTSASGNDTNVPPESCQLPDNGHERPAEKSKTTAKPMDDVVASIKDRTVYRKYFGSIGTANMMVFLFFGIAFAFCIKFPDIWAQWWSEDSHKGSHNVGYWLGLYAMLQVLPLVMMAIWLGHMMMKIVPASGVGLHRQLLKTVLNSTFYFASTTDSGDLLNRFTQDLMMVDMELPIHMLNTTTTLWECMIQIVLVAVAAVYAIAVLPAVMIVLFLIQYFYLRTSKQLRQQELQSKASLHTKVLETCTGLEIIRAHGWQGTWQREFRKDLDRSQEPFYLLYSIQRWLQLTLDLVVAGLSVVVTGMAVGIRNKTTVGAIGVAFLNLTTLGETLTTLINSWTSLEVSLGAIARIEAFERSTPLEPEVDSPVDVPSSWPASGMVKFDDVWSSYTPEPESPIWSLHGVSFEIQPGESIAICGRSGAGKSTLLLTLLALVETRKGTISIDGVDISRVNRSVLRSRFHVIAQDTYLQGETLRDALDPHGGCSDENIWDILAHCAIKEKVESSGGLSALLKDVTFSSGEAQLCSLARTVLEAGHRSGGIILFDEATSGVDMANEQRVRSLIKERLPDKTTISILHRLEAAVEYDRILVMDDGKVIHFGSPAEVVRDSELFSSLRH